ncbi:MAG: ATP-binding cassette domain-containing protein [Patescibacteria group bacterium]
MAQDNVVIRFNQVSFRYSDKKVILDEANFSVRKNSIMTIMGQNGAGKSTIFKLLLGELTPQAGKINMELGTTVGIAKQMIPADQQQLDIVSYFKTALPDKEYGIEGDIVKILSVVNLDIPLTRIVSSLSGGQKARLLLAYALISSPDVLLLDEPTNNLDSTGIEHLTTFLINYQKTCLVISHDADFLNCFTDGVINLDVATKKTEQFEGNYYDVISEMAAKLERDRLLNSRLEKSIKDRFEKVNRLGGKSIAMSQLARRIREDIEEDREEMVDMRKEDKTIPDFIIQNQEYVGEVIKLTKPVELGLNKGSRLLIKGPNGIGKSTLLKSILRGESASINPEVRVGYYSQDFSELDMDQTGYESLYSVSQTKRVQDIYEAGGRFLLSSEVLNNKVESLSEGQKGLLCYARFMLQIPGLLILDEPTNHINFRHIPVIAKAINNYEGPIIFVSHLADFVDKIKVTTELDLEKYRQ